MTRQQESAGCLGCLVAIGISLVLWFALWFLASAAVDMVF